jgi:hypothetical protein
MDTAKQDTIAIHAIVTEIVATEEQRSDVAVFQWLIDERDQIHDMIETVGEDPMGEEPDPSA